MSKELEKEQLLNRIEVAFEDVLRPADEELLHADCSDDMDIVWLHPYKGSWRELIEGPIEQETATLAFLSPKAFQWVLPAYLTYGLSNIDTIQSTLIEDTIYTLCPQAGLFTFMESKFSCFGIEQQKVVKEFLEFFRDHASDIAYEGVLEAGLLYWEKQNGKCSN